MNNNLTCAYFSNGLVQPPTIVMIFKFQLFVFGLLVAGETPPQNSDFFSPWPPAGEVHRLLSVGFAVGEHRLGLPGVSFRNAKTEDFETKAKSFKLGPMFGGFQTWCQMYGGGFKHYLFSPLLGEMIQFDIYLWDGLKSPTRNVWWCWWEIRNSLTKVHCLGWFHI